MRRRLLVVASLAMLGCAPVVDDPLIDAECPGRAPLRRLNALEYANTVRALLDVDVTLTRSFPADPLVDGFDDQAAGQAISPLLAEDYMIAAEQLAGLVLVQLDTLLACESGSTIAAESKCAAEFIESFGLRVYRRPLTADQRASLLETYTRGREQDGSFEAGLRWVSERMFQSPQFLYRLELDGRRGVDRQGAQFRALDDWELASRLSYLVWRSMPDARLFELAEAGQLHTRDALEAEARRMLADTRARATVLDFHRQWLQLRQLDQALKSSTQYPEWGPSLRASMASSVDRYVEHVVFESDGTLTELLGADYGFADVKLAAVYGVEHSGAAGVERVELPTDQRRGILTHPALLTGFAQAEDGSPTRRGRFVREQLLCEPLSPPPPGVASLPPFDPDVSERERLQQHVEDPSCAGCHLQMDPIGFGFERYDAIGRFASDAGSGPIDASGTVFGLDGVDIEFDGAVELAGLLVDHEAVRRCYARQWFRYGLGRHEDPSADACSLDLLDEALRESDGDIMELVVAIVVSDAFMTRTLEGLE